MSCSRWVAYTLSDGQQNTCLHECSPTAKQAWGQHRANVHYRLTADIPVNMLCTLEGADLLVNGDT